MAAPRLYMKPWLAKRSSPVSKGQPSAGSSGYSCISLSMMVLLWCPSFAMNAEMSESLFNAPRGVANNAVPSSVFVPARMATLATRSLVSDSDGRRRRKSPSTMGPQEWL